MAKARAKAQRGNRFDDEALGLVLLSLGVFLAVTVLSPVVAKGGIMSELHGPLLNWLGWGAYLLPLIPTLYGMSMFNRWDFRQLTRRIVGAVIIVLSLLALHEVVRPGDAGEGAAQVMKPLLAKLSYAAALLPLTTLTLGIDILVGKPILSLLKAFFRLVSIGVSHGMTQVQGAVEAQRDGIEAARARTELRRMLSAHMRDVEALRAAYPHVEELRLQSDEIRFLQREVGKFNDTELKNLERDVKAWQERLLTFVAGEGRDLRAAVLTEAPEAGAEAEALLGELRGKRHVLSTPLNNTLASGSVEQVRRDLVLELQHIAQQAGRLERERKASEKALIKPDAALLLRERQAHTERLQGWRELSERLTAFRERQELYGGWPALAAEFDAAPTHLAESLAQAFQKDTESTLRNAALWRVRLEKGREEEARKQAELQAARAALPKIDFDFSEYQLDFQFAPAAEEAIPPVSVPVPTPQPVAPLDAEPLLTETGSDEAQGVLLASMPVPTPSKPALTVTPPWESDKPERPEPKPVQGALELAIPSYDLLDPIPATAANTAQLDAQARSRATLIDETLRQFNLQAKVVDFARGPTVTRYEIEPAPGEKISRIASLSNDLARALAVGGVRIEAPVPGKSVIGLEVPNAEREPVTFHQAAASVQFRSSRAKLPIILGKSIDGELLVGDLAKMPHVLIAGSTGSGKSVCVNVLITSLLYRYLPTELRFLMIDPKMVELTPYDGIPHLVRGVVTNPMDAAGVLLGAVAHMERRYKMLSGVGAKNLEQYNAKMRQIAEAELPHIVIIIDELADLMITSPKEVESAIMRLAQMARAVGMHLVLATQRPSVDILTSLIKVNVPARVAFAVSSGHDSRTILDSLGAERLTGMGDMLFYQPGLIKPMRLQGPYISEIESARITDELRRQVFDDLFVELYGSDFDGEVQASGPSVDSSQMDFSDPLLRQAAQIAIEEGQGSVSRLQRRLSVGHARAGKLMDMLEAMGIVGKHQGSKPREVLITEADLPEYFGK